MARRAQTKPPKRSAPNLTRARGAATAALAATPDLTPLAKAQGSPGLLGTVHRDPAALADGADAINPASPVAGAQAILLHTDASRNRASSGHYLAGRAASLSSQIVAQVREDLFARRLAPGDFLGTEKDLAARFGTSRIVARDALRTLEALGVVEIKMGKGGGARIAKGNARLFAEALAVQLTLTGVSAGEVLDAQRAIECLAAELAAENARPADIAKINRLVAEAERAMTRDIDEYTRLSREFHLAVAEASHNRVLVVQLISLDHVAWPSRNPNLTPQVARRVLAVHKELASMIEMRDGPGARRLMDDHVKMIRARRVSDERARIERDCC